MKKAMSSLILLAALAPMAALAERVQCESHGHQLQECEMNTRGEVRMVKQLSHTRCVEGRNWGINKHSVWVSDGCRAVFESSGGSYSDNTPGGLQDLVGESARHVDSEMQRRGYRQRDNWVDGDHRYGAWEEQENGNCVRVGVANGRIVSIENTSRSECRSSGRSSSDNAARSNTPGSLQDLVGESARHVDSEMHRRGYRQRDNWVDGDHRYGAWEEQENGNCVRVGVSNGRIVSIENTDRSECRQ